MLNIDELLENTVDLGEEELTRPIYRIDIDRLLDLTHDR